MNIPKVLPEAVPTGFAPDVAEPLRLRRAIATDARALSVVGSATFLEAYTWMLPGADIVDFCATKQTEAYYAKYLADPQTRITLATTGLDAPVGYAMVCKPELPEFDVQPGDIELKRIYLLSRFRSSKTEVIDHHGLRGGQALMNAAVDDARALGATRLLLGTNAGNQRAIEFYIRNGFTEAGMRTFHVGAQVCTDYILAKSL